MPKYIDAEEIPSLFNEEYKRTRKLIEQGETHLDNLAEGFLEAKQVIDRMDSADVAKVKHRVWIPTKLGMPEENVPVNITWVNRNPVSYYSHIKDKPFTATGVYFYGKWYWFSATVTDMLAEYGKCTFNEINDDIEIIAWMPLLEPYEVKEDNNDT